MINTKKNIQNNSLLFSLVIFLGIVLRFCIMAFGHNFDWESYCIVGKIINNGGNVYAETSRYNYGPFFFLIQGLLYKISTIAPSDTELLLYRVLMVATLTLSDLGIALFIGKKYSVIGAMVFFLNPVSIIITGYHNQFDNIAILFALISTLYYNEEERFSAKDYWFVFWLTLCLIAKHILFLMPVFLLLKKDLPIKKKMVYVVLPPLLFLLSFIPFCVGNTDAFYGILNNVFLYRSFNNAPLLMILYKIIGFPDGLKFFVYIGMMCILAYYVRRFNFDNIVLLYSLAMVAFSSAIANQYLVIPLAALCVLNTGLLKYLYIVFASGFLLLHNDGLGYIQLMDNGIFLNICSNYLRLGYIVATWLLFVTLLYVLRKNEKQNQKKEIQTAL